MLDTDMAIVPPVDEWRRVSESLPVDSETVLGRVKCSNRGVFLASVSFKKTGETFEFSMGSRPRGGELVCVTHWVPIAKEIPQLLRERR